MKFLLQIHERVGTVVKLFCGLCRESPEEFLAKFAKNKEVKESQPGGHGFTKVAEKAKESTSKGAYSFAPQKVKIDYFDISKS